MVIGYAFVDAADGHLKVKKADNVIVEYTNTLNDIQILDLTDYTAFEVYAHDTRINAGALSGQTHINYIGNQNDIITFAVAPSMTETFILRSEQPQSEQDVIVDWGDGNQEKVIDITPTESPGEYRFTLTHTYSTTGTYIVKIFGKTYFSFSSSGSVNTSLISRIFDYDLPIASHIWNLSAAFQHSNRLLHVNMWSHPASYQIIHWSAAFTSARNLIDCVGFSKYAHRESNYNMFQNCIGLVTTDLRIADNPADLATGNGYTFTNCPKLAMNISSLLPVQGFKSGSTINIARLFKGCALLSGIVPADKLWNNPNITWTNTSEAFTGCSEALSGQVPQSWGGSASNDIINPKTIVNSINGQTGVVTLDIPEDKDYTAFEVYAKGTTISGGTYDANLGGDGTPLEDIVASRTHRMRIRTGSLDTANSDVIVDWGDGHITKIADFETATLDPSDNGEFVAKSVASSDKETDYTVGHTYATDGKYTIKIFGRDYYSICTPSNTQNREAEFNLICRVLDYDLPLASCVTNISSLCAYAKHLLSVHVPSYFDLSRMTNIGGIFRGCRNLQTVKGLKNQFLIVNNASQIFSDCYSLTTCEFTFPAVVTRSGLAQVFQNCIRLTTPIQNLFPAGGFNAGTLNINNLFNDARVITGTVPDNLLWNNTNVTWTNTSAAFANCPAEIRSQVPVSWGGTASDDIITGGIVNSINGQTGDVQLDLASVSYQTVSGLSLSSHVYTNVSGELTGLICYGVPSGLQDAMCTFKTGSNVTFAISVDEDMKLNKAFEFEGNKNYIIAADNGVIFWNELKAELSGDPQVPHEYAFEITNCPYDLINGKYYQNPNNQNEYYREFDLCYMTVNIGGDWIDCQIHYTKKGYLLVNPGATDDDWNNYYWYICMRKWTIRFWSMGYNKLVCRRS